MVKKSVCSFCRSEIEYGRGTMRILNDGTIMYFCSSKCRTAMIKHKKNPRKTRWTKVYGTQ
ncbi:MAG TPA: 50S ribosomal protein L24e [Candidatus Lokiarchaeia archaeon]|nr:50S ribosomal protein L24e [Candidatus Lokiarchaeia archaeon]